MGRTQLVCSGGESYGPVLAVSVRGSDVYIGGYFTGVGTGPDSARIARWDGKQWSGLDTGVGGAGFGYVDVITVDLRGPFTSAAISRRPAAPGPVTSPNGTARTGRP